MNFNTFRLWDEIMEQVRKDASDVDIYKWLKFKPQEDLEYMHLFIDQLLRTIKDPANGLCVSKPVMFRRIKENIKGVFSERRILDAI